MTGYGLGVKNDTSPLAIGDGTTKMIFKSFRTANGSANGSGVRSGIAGDGLRARGG